MRCPFLRLKSIGASSSPSLDAPSACPFHYKRGAQVQEGKENPESAQDSTPGTKPNTDPEKDAPLVCPYGYGAATGPKLSALHCPLCRALIYESQESEPCGHIFCKYCLSRFRDCPLCGRDVKGSKPHEQTRRDVVAFLDAHEKESGELQRTNSFPEGLDPSIASFYLQIGLQSYAGGNYEAAVARLTRAQEELQHEVDSGVADARVYCKLSAVCGAVGDSHRRLGNVEAAKNMYQKSIDCFEPLGEKDDEVVHSLTVSINKLGDLHYMAGEGPAALQHYKQALQLRRSAWGSREQGGADKHLDVAASLIKVADGHSLLGQVPQCQDIIREAQGMLKGMPAGLSEAQGRKCRQYEEVLRQMMDDLRVGEHT